MSQVLDFTQALGPSREARAVRQASDEPDEIWPGVVCHPEAEDAPADPANAPRRVLFEVFLILAAAGVLVAAVTFLVPGP
jgi:hypothetical protein